MCFLALSKLSNNKKVNHYRLIERQNLHDYSIDNDKCLEEANKPTIRVTLKIDHDENDEQSNEEIKPNVHYYPGDHLAVYPENSSELVQGIIDRLCSLNPSLQSTKPYVIKIRSQHSSMDNHTNESMNSASSLFGIGNNNSNFDGNKSPNHLEKQKWILHDRLPSPVTLKEALTRYLDITNPPTQRILSILSEHASNSDESELLKNLSKDSAAYETWKAKYFPNFLEV